MPSGKPVRSNTGSKTDVWWKSRFWRERERKYTHHSEIDKLFGSVGIYEEINSRSGRCGDEIRAISDGPVRVQTRSGRSPRSAVGRRGETLIGKSISHAVPAVRGGAGPGTTRIRTDGTHNKTVLFVIKTFA